MPPRGHKRWSDEEPAPHWPRNKRALYEMGRLLACTFCEMNHVPAPQFRLVEKKDWPFEPCAYYRPATPAVEQWTARLGAGHGPGVNLCLDKCASPCDELPGRQWSWPASTTDREPYGVVAHELGHHCDWLTGHNKGSYGSEYSSAVMKESGEPPVTSYAPNPWEWFAEIFRLFVTNPDLLRLIRPRAYNILTQRWKPCIISDWRTALGDNVPPKVVKALENKGAK
jgi:hypothetical protein